ncbi:MAG: hypothetical protein ABL903_07905 [Methylococcales bacterium]
MAAIITAWLSGLALSSDHTIAVELLPAIHKDPFDRILLAQALTEKIYFLTVDQTLLQYGEPVFDIGTLNS